MSILLSCWLAGSALAAEPVRLKVFFPHHDEAERAVYLDLIARYNWSHPEVEVTPVAWQGFVTNAHDATVRFLALEDASVDVYRIDNPWVAELADPGWLLPLDDVLPPDLRDITVPAAWEGGRYRGNTWAVPLDLSGNVLYYRKDWLAEAGLKPPDTLDELEAQASLLRQRHGLDAGLGLHNPLVYNDVLPMLWASGGALLDGETIVLDSGVNVRVVEEVASWVGDGPEHPVPRALFLGPWAQDYRAPLSAFSEGRSAFVITWASRYALIDRPGSTVSGVVGAVPIPGLEPGLGASNLGSWYLAVNRFSRHPEEAVDFLVWMSSAELQRERLARLGTIPSRVDLLDDPALQASHPQLSVLRPALERARSRPKLPNEREVGATFEAALQRVLRDEVEAGPALHDAAAEIRARRVYPPLPAPPPMSDEWWTQPPPGAGLPLRIGTAVGAGVAGVAAGLLWLQSVGRIRWLDSILARLSVLGVAFVVALLAVSTGIQADRALDAQQRDVIESVAFYRERMTDEARTQAKQLALAASLLAEEGDDGGPSPVSELMMSSLFTEDLLFLELLDPDGEPIYSDRDLLFTGEVADRYPRSADARNRIRHRSIVLGERDDEDGRAYLEVYAPVFKHGMHLGALRLGASEATYRSAAIDIRARHEAEIRNLVLGSVQSAAVLVGLGAVFVWGFSWWLTGPIRELTSKAERIRGGDLDVRFEGAGSDEIGTLARTMQEMVEGLRDRDFVRDLFGRYVTPELADQVLENRERLQLGGHLREMTILLSDLRGFTRLSTHLGPVEMVDLLNRYLSRMTDVILAHGGTVNEFIGDAILVLFGAPVPQEDHAVRAARCAVAMQQAMREFNEENRALGLPALEMGIGISTGEVVAGNIGGERRVKYGVVGPPVNMAGRIEALTAGGQVLINATTREVLGDRAEVAPSLEVRMKGRVEPLEIFELYGMDGERIPGLDPDEASEVELSVRFQILEGKRVAGAHHDGTWVRMTANRAWMRTPTKLSVLDNLVFEVALPGRNSSDLYAKVRAVEEGLVSVQFTSVDPEDRAALDGILDESEIPATGEILLPPGK